MASLRISPARVKRSNSHEMHELDIEVTARLRELERLLERRAERLLCAHSVRAERLIRGAREKSADMRRSLVS
jgi:hypothetical protein